MTGRSSPRVMSCPPPGVAAGVHNHAAHTFAWKRVGWLLPYVGVWLAALIALKFGDLGTDCTTLCLVVHGWLWYSVLYATLSLSAFVGAIEVLFWILRLDRDSNARVESANH